MTEIVVQAGDVRPGVAAHGVLNQLNGFKRQRAEVSRLCGRSDSRCREWDEEGEVEKLQRIRVLLIAEGAGGDIQAIRLVFEPELMAFRLKGKLLEARQIRRGAAVDVEHARVELLAHGTQIVERIAFVDIPSQTPGMAFLVNGVVADHV